eukprot:scaffold1584_cov259-Pinguiococcus_pyrenoidosus.AAC.6
MLFSDEFRVVDLNPDGKKFERVNRLVCTGSSAGAANVSTDLVLDINCEVFRPSPSAASQAANAQWIPSHVTQVFEVERDENLYVALMSTLDGKPDSGEYVPYEEGDGSVLDDYEYAMHGLIFDVQHDEVGGPPSFDRKALRLGVAR